MMKTYEYGYTAFYDWRKILLELRDLRNMGNNGAQSAIDANFWRTIG